MKPNNEFIMLPTNDFCFQQLMNNSKVRKGFIAALLHVPAEDVTDTQVLPAVLDREYEDDKMGILDIHVLLRDGSHMNLEMQVQYFKYWNERSLFYLCKMFDSQIKKSEYYNNLHKCIQVSILNFNRFPEDDLCYRTIHFRDDKTRSIYTDKLEIQILELKKLPKDIKTGEDIVSWMKFFCGKSRKEFETMAKSNEYLEEAYNQLLKLSADDELRLLYERREKVLRDHYSFIEAAKEDAMEEGMKEGIEKGMKEGIEKGIEKGIEQTKHIFKLHIQGKSSAEIAEICHLPVEKVEEILH